MTPDYQPRFVAYAAAHGNTPEEQIARDRARYPGGEGAGFIVWVGQMWAAFDRAQGLPHVARPRSPGTHARFDAWLSRTIGIE